MSQYKKGNTNLDSTEARSLNISIKAMLLTSLLLDNAKEIIKKQINKTRHNLWSLWATISPVIQIKLNQSVLETLSTSNYLLEEARSL